MHPILQPNIFSSYSHISLSNYHAHGDTLVLIALIKLLAKTIVYFHAGLMRIYSSTGNISVDVIVDRSVMLRWFSFLDFIYLGYVENKLFADVKRIKEKENKLKKSLNILEGLRYTSKNVVQKFWLVSSRVRKYEITRYIITDIIVRDILIYKLTQSFYPSSKLHLHFTQNALCFGTVRRLKQRGKLFVKTFHKVEKNKVRETTVGRITFPLEKLPRYVWL